MINITFRTQALLITMPILALIASSDANAEIYKWRDNRGVTQYSDRPPVNNSSKLTPNEIVNSLQTKDLCAVGPIKKSVTKNIVSAEEQNGFFNIFSQARAKAALAASTASAPAKVATSQAVVTLPISVVTALIPPVKVAASEAVVKLPVPVITAPIATTATTSQTPIIKTSAVTSSGVTDPPAQTETNTALPIQRETLSNIIQSALMPAVDVSKNIIPAIGNDLSKIKTTAHPANPLGGGDFRTGCFVSHMSNDDPLVYPNQQGAAHHHTFFGNTSLNYKSNLNTLSSTGNSTCSGGIANRSAYWIPSMIDTSTNMPVIPDDVGLYYKHGLIDGTLIKVPPKGLKILAGNSKATSDRQSKSNFSCLPSKSSSRKSWPWSRQIPTGSNCEVGDKLNFMISFPQCWDGKNLDSPNHMDHMAYPIGAKTGYACPTSHPVAIPHITFNIWFNIKSSGTKYWRLASDNYSANLPGGYSGHADWVNGWDEKIFTGIVKNCINAKKDCHSNLLGDGTTLF